MPGGARRVRPLLAALAGFVVMLVVAEWAVGRWIMAPSATYYDPELGLLHRPGARFVNSLEGWSETRVNSLGRFDDEPRTPRAPHVALLLGDSYAEALQVARAEGFAQVAERALPGLDLVNVAQSGRAPAHYERFAAVYQRRLRPDLLVMQVNDGDVPELVDPKPGDAIEAELFAAGPRAAERLAEIEASPSHRLKRLLGRSALVRYARLRLELLDGKERQRLGRKFGLVPGPDGAPLDAIPAGADSAADRAIAALRAVNPNLVIVYIPGIDYFKDPPGPDRPARGDFWRAAAARNGVELVDPTAAFLAEYARTRQPLHGFQNATIGVGHINAAGHRVLGALLARRLAERLVAGRDSASSRG